MKLVRGLACTRHDALLSYTNHNRSCPSNWLCGRCKAAAVHTPTTGQRFSFAVLVGACLPLLVLPAMGYEDRTAQGPNGGAIGMVDDHTKMTDDFTEFVEKMVGSFRVPAFCFALCSRFPLFFGSPGLNRTKRVDFCMLERSTSRSTVQQRAYR